MLVHTFLQAEVLAILVKRADKIEAVVALGELNTNVRLLAGLLVDQEFIKLAAVALSNGVSVMALVVSHKG